jgi:uridine kinase
VTPVTASTKRSKPLLLGVAGGSGSGKTFFARDLVRCLGGDCCEILFQDSFYIDQSARFDRDGGAVNFDHPDSLDFTLMANCLAKLKAGESCEIPVYDFSTHKRLARTERLHPKPVIVVDGILIFHPPEIRRLLDELLFFETPEALRYQRRLDRDVKERGRSEAGVRAQFQSQVKPMHDQFVEPSKAHAQRIVREENYAETVNLYCRRFGK